MKIAEALQERSDLQRKISHLEYRMSKNVLVQEGEKTVENLDALKNELDSAVERWTNLVTCINITNNLTTIDGKSLTRLIAEKDALRKKIDTLMEVTRTAENVTFRAKGSEIRVRAAIDVPEWQKEIDRISAEYRRLDQTLQRTNWKIDLIE